MFSLRMMQFKKGEEDIRNIIIIGGGIAGATAAVYTARASLKPLIFSGVELDQLSTTTVVENYPGFPDGVVGPELVVNTKKQAIKFGAEYIESNVEAVQKKGDLFEVTAEGKKYVTNAIIICTGASPRSLGIKGEKEYWGRGVSTCATCDSPLYKNKTVAVIGGGDSAMEETLALTKFAKKIYLIHRKEEFRASQIMQDRVFKQKEKIEIMWNTEAKEVLGDKFVTGVKVFNNKTSQEKELKIDGYFLAIGHIPNTQLFKRLLKLDEEGYVVTDKQVHTSVPGIFAAGDCQDRIYRQAITSAGTGCQAALEAERYVENKKET